MIVRAEEEALSERQMKNQRIIENVVSVSYHHSNEALTFKRPRHFSQTEK